MHEHAEAREAAAAQGVPRRARDEEYAVHDGRERDEVERDRRRDRRADEAQSHRLWAPHCSGMSASRATSEYGGRTEEVVERGVDGRYDYYNSGGDREETWAGGGSASRRRCLKPRQTQARSTIGVEGRAYLGTGNTAYSDVHSDEIAAYQHESDMRRGGKRGTHRDIELNV